ncbi:ankyrin repeat domain-containing protein 39 [Osmerus mordax]|uniref:Ankyrin repeat domain-containing protein 39 n=1 Tax=Osmerus mordax TaxID=8014 RepID=C1BLF9_OSMMO|nr:Ankyrin repeat domain-containing protein 39 [Osmerus mordax]
MESSPHCAHCSLQAASASTHQTLDEMDFERGIWSAAMNGDLGRTQALLQKGTEPNQRDSSNYTALHYASRSGHEAVCRLLLDSGACVNALTLGRATPLHRSAYCGHHAVVRMLLRHGADPQLCDDDGSSALHKAAAQGHQEVCDLLIQHCPNLRNLKNKKGHLPYQLAPEGHLLQELIRPPL